MDNVHIIKLVKINGHRRAEKNNHDPGNYFLVFITVTLNNNINNKYIETMCFNNKSLQK